MAGPYTGTWRATIISDAAYTGAQRWGTGINPIHAIEGAGTALRLKGTNLNFDPITTPGGQETDVLTEDYAWDSTLNPDPGLPGYNVTPATTWGYNSETGLADRPRWGSEMADADAPISGVGLPHPIDPGRPITVVRGHTQNDTNNEFPPWGGSRKVGPAGRFIRAIRRGPTGETAMRVLPGEDVAQGWVNKDHGIEADSRPSDVSQLIMQTSQIQRYKARAGSQNIGSQSDFNAPVQSRVTGQKLKTYISPTSARHWDMLPYEQEDFVRPFLSRQAGVGYREWNLPNAMYVSPTVQREPSADPEMGPIAGADITSVNAGPASDYGYSYEDSGVYY